MSPRTLTIIGILTRFPRVSGDEPRYAGASKFATMFSPRERG